METALAKEKDLLAGAEGPTVAVHLRGGDKRQENADLVRIDHTPLFVTPLAFDLLVSAHWTSFPPLRRTWAAAAGARRARTRAGIKGFEEGLDVPRRAALE